MLGRMNLGSLPLIGRFAMPPFRREAAPAAPPEKKEAHQKNDKHAEHDDHAGHDHAKEPKGVNNRGFKAAAKPDHDGHDHAAAQPKNGQRVVVGDGGGTISFLKEQQWSLDVLLRRPELKQLSGQLSASGELELDSYNFGLLVDAARTAGSFRELKPFDNVFFAKSGDEEMRIEALSMMLHF